MRVHYLTPCTEINGPGKRFMVHMQGCKFDCEGCFNPHTHDLEGGIEISIKEIVNLIPEDTEGLTISGGEPFLQQKELLELLISIHTLNLSAIVFSGFYLDEIMELKYGKQILKYTDVLIDGRFDNSQIATSGLKGSSNQTIHCLTSRYSQQELFKREVEIIFNEEGECIITGFPKNELINQIK